MGAVSRCGIERTSVGGASLEAHRIEPHFEELAVLRRAFGGLLGRVANQQKLGDLRHTLGRACIRSKGKRAGSPGRTQCAEG